MNSGVLEIPSQAAKQQQLFTAVSRLRDPQARFAWAVEQARNRAPLPEELRIDAHRVTGCQVRLWFVPEMGGGRCVFRTDSDAVTLKAMTGLLCELASGATPAEVAACDFAFLEQFGLLRQLAENRRATVLRVADQIRAFAAAHAPSASSGAVANAAAKSSRPAAAPN